MSKLQKTIVIGVISLLFSFATIPAFCTGEPPAPAPVPLAPTPVKNTNTVDQQRFVPETPQQRINKANDDALRFKQVIPPEGSLDNKKMK
jgi:hypothetical protein